MRPRPLVSRTSALLALVAVFSLVLVACGEASDPDKDGGKVSRGRVAKAIPKRDQMRMAYASQDSSPAALLGDQAELLSLGRATAKDIEGFTMDLMGLLEGIMEEDVTSVDAGGVHHWGPWDMDGESFHLAVQETESDQFLFVFEVKGAGEALPVLQGEFTQASEEGQGSWYMVYDLGALSEALDDPDAGGTIRILLEDEGESRTLIVDFEGVPDEEGGSWDAAFEYQHFEGEFGVLYYADLGDLGSADAQMAILWLTFLPDGSGRGDVVFTGGALPGTLTECWDEEGKRSYWLDSGEPLSMEGSPSSCVVELSEEVPDEAPEVDRDHEVSELEDDFWEE